LWNLGGALIGGGGGGGQSKVPGTFCRSAAGSRSIGYPERIIIALFITDQFNE
jgi:hypothetical protein